MSVMKASRRGRKQGIVAELNLEALLEPCRLLLLGGSLNTTEEAIKKILILVDEAPWTLRPWSKLPPLPLPLGSPVHYKNSKRFSYRVARRGWLTYGDAQSSHDQGTTSYSNISLSVSATNTGFHSSLLKSGI